jgi:broad specificity phosphatase PhoE
MIFLTFLRHGRSQADDERRFESRYDAELSQQGTDQVQKLVQEWKHHEKRLYEIIVCSPLKRAKSTAAILSTFYKVPVVENQYFNELDAGALCGMDKEEGARKYPQPQFISPYYRIIEGSGESEAQLHARAGLAVECIMNMGKKSYLVIAHGMILNAVLRCLMSIPMPVNMHGVAFRFGDCAYMDLLYDEAVHHWTILGFFSTY